MKELTAKTNWAIKTKNKHDITLAWESIKIDFKTFKINFLEYSFLTEKIIQSGYFK